jgi:hypothetical protein
MEKTHMTNKSVRHLHWPHFHPRHAKTIHIPSLLPWAAKVFSNGKFWVYAGIVAVVAMLTLLMILAYMAGPETGPPPPFYYWP